MPVWWTNRSLPASSGVMNPKPLSSLNHFTVPVAIFVPLEVCASETRRVRRGNDCRDARHGLAGRTPDPLGESSGSTGDTAADVPGEPEDRASDGPAGHDKKSRPPPFSRVASLAGGLLPLPADQRLRG